MSHHTLLYRAKNCCLWNKLLSNKHRREVVFNFTAPSFTSMNNTDQQGIRDVFSNHGKGTTGHYLMAIKVIDSLNRNKNFWCIVQGRSSIT